MAVINILPPWDMPLAPTMQSKRDSRQADKREIAPTSRPLGHHLVTFIAFQVEDSQSKHGLTEIVADTFTSSSSVESDGIDAVQTPLANLKIAVEGKTIDIVVMLWPGRHPSGNLGCW
ncbi:hypothetical protein Tdes44962_MAKER00943 [Teratosphaeria destructans]|uniref:Uncharacterized protein n=1 Tax=Teratosphaeria destructans TaxID=418781 RepID=A0A9W7SJH2_9PEZI|nr:hypothetical protein Tdes44962_MAKER00943 [Teratosphaeria destructans]